jgi:spermidine/putrescine transport system permease protein
LPTAWFIATQPPGKREFWLFLVTVPFWSNLLVRTIAIQELIRAEGVINNLLLLLGIIDEPLQMMFTNFAIAFGMTYVYLPLMVLPIYAAVDKLDFRLVEAAHDLYASRWRTFWRVILPLIKPGIIAGSILVFIPSLGAYVTPRVLGGGKNLMFGNLIELQFGQGRNWPLGAALSLMLMAAVMVSLIWYVRVTSRERSDV